MSLNDLYTAIWVGQSTLAVLVIAFNVIRAKRKLLAVKADETRTMERKLQLLGLAYTRLMRQATFFIAMSFNAAAGWLVYLTDPSPMRSGLTILLLVAGDFVLLLLSLIDAGYDD